MDLPDNLITIFSAEIEWREGDPVVTIPERELTVGELQESETYRIAVLPQVDRTSATESRSTLGSQSTSEDSSPPVSEGEIIDVEIEDIGDQGDGIARIGPGYIVFVPDTAPGDRVTVEITDVQDTFALAEVVEHEPVPG